MENTGRQHRVLIIDDSIEDRSTYRRLIARNMETDFLFWEADCGEDGLRLYHAEQPDCVLLDYNLPDLNGLEFLARLDPEREDDAPPIIMLTGQGTERVAVQALKLGAQDYLIKNRAADTVKYVVHSLIEKSALSRQIKEERREKERSVRALQQSEERYRLWGVRALRESEERYRLLIEGVMDYAIIMLDPTGHVILWNSGAERLYGYRADEIIGKNFSCFYLPEAVDDNFVAYELESAISNGNRVQDGWRIRKDGSQFLVHSSVTPLRNEFGDLRGFANVTHAIVDTKKIDTEKDQ